MREPICVPPLTEEERARLQAGLRSKDAFVRRRCPIWLASARGERARALARALGGDSQTGRTARAPGWPRRHRARVAPSTPASRAPERQRALLPQSPRQFGQPTGVWTLALAAAGITAARVSAATLRTARTRLGVGWKRAKRW